MRSCPLCNCGTVRRTGICIRCEKASLAEKERLAKERVEEHRRKGRRSSHGVLTMAAILAALGTR